MPATDDFPNGASHGGGAEDFGVVTPSDSVDLSFRCRALYVGTTGNMSDRD